MALDVLARPRGILDLETEILAEILQHVDQESPWTTTALSSVSQHFRDVVTLVQHRRTTLIWSAKDGDFNYRKSYRPRTASKKSPTPNDINRPNWKTEDLLHRVRILTIARSSVCPPADIHKLDTELVDILKNATNITHLIWQEPFIPGPDVIRALSAYHPKAQLKIQRMVPVGAMNEQTHRSINAETALASSDNLRTFGMSASSPRIRTPVRDPSNSFDYHKRINYAKIIGSAPFLESVSLMGRLHFDANEEVMQSMKRSTTVKNLTLEDWPLSAETLDVWSRYIDLSKLESFQFSKGFISATYFPRAIQTLTGLKHFNLNMRAVKDAGEAEADAAREFLENCPPLQTLSLWSWMDTVSLEQVLKQHGPKLQTFHLHEREELWPNMPQEFLSLDQIKEIRKACPNLKSFMFDLRRQSKQPKVSDYQEILDEVRAMNLDTLEIYLDSGINYIMTRLRDDANPEYDDGEDDSDWDYPEQPNQPQGANDFVASHEVRTSSALENSAPTSTDGVNIDPTVPKAPFLNLCGGAFTSEGLQPISVKEDDNGIPVTLHRPLPDDTILHPPSSADNIAEFSGEVWKFIFGSRSSGPRRLDIKFGEWERKIMPEFTRGDHYEIQKDMRVWVRARPHERDDMKGQCFAEMKCCQGKHWKRWATN